MLNTDAALLEAARTRHGIVSSELLLLLGFTRGQIARRVDAGLMESVHPGVYLVTGFPFDFRARAHAAAMVSSTIVVGSRSGAYLRGFGAGRPPVVEVITTGSRPRALDGVRVRRASSLPDHHIEIHDHLLMTTPARSIFDASAVTGPGAISRMINRAVHQRLTTFDHILGVVADLGTRGHRGAGRLRRVLDELGGHSVTESVLEDDVLAFLHHFGLPTPERQVVFTAVDGRKLRVDFLYRAERVVLEAEGRLWHTHPDDFQDDIERSDLRGARRDAGADQLVRCAKATSQSGGHHRPSVGRPTSTGSVRLTPGPPREVWPIRIGRRYTSAEPRRGCRGWRVPCGPRRAGQRYSVLGPLVLAGREPSAGFPMWV
ncbi:MAG: type IV toxin-antitoxin system AbiEi family antitoxin domain-containing protein [Acidimicrobiia bacterium]